METVKAELVGTILTIVTSVVIPYLVALARSYIKSKVAHIDDKCLRENIEWAMERLEHTTDTVVREIDQSVKQYVDGRVADPEALRKLALDNVLKRLPNQAMGLLERQYSIQQLGAVVTGKIEAKVHNLKMCDPMNLVG